MLNALAIKCLWPTLIRFSTRRNSEKWVVLVRYLLLTVDLAQS